MRVQGVYDLAEWLLEGTPGGPAGAWDKQALLAEMKTGAREDIRLDQPVPVIWVYLTGWANAGGAANFRDDVYGIDPQAKRPPEWSRSPRPMCTRRRPRRRSAGRSRRVRRRRRPEAPAQSGLFSLPLFAPFTPHPDDNERARGRCRTASILTAHSSRSRRAAR